MRRDGRRLRGSPESEDWIATFPRVGYRFAGPLSVEEYECLIEATEDAEDLLHHERVMAKIGRGERVLWRER